MELKWQDKMKKAEKFNQGVMGNEGANVRPCIAALMTKVLTDIEHFGAADHKFSEAQMGLLYKKKTKEKYKTTDQ